MKVTIELESAELEGIKKYLKEVCEVKRPNKRDISQFLKGELNGLLWMNTAVSDYVTEASRNERLKQ